MVYTEKWKVALTERPNAVVPWGEHVIVAYQGLLEARSAVDGTVVAQGFHTFYESSQAATFDLDYAYSGDGRGVIFYKRQYSVMTVTQNSIDFTPPDIMAPGYLDYDYYSDGLTWGNLRLTDAAGRPGGGLRLFTGQRVSFNDQTGQIVYPGSGVQAFFYSLSGTTVTVDEVQTTALPPTFDQRGRRYPPNHWMPLRRGLRHVGDGIFDNGNGAQWGRGQAVPGPRGGPDESRMSVIHIGTAKGNAVIYAKQEEVIPS